MRTDDLPESNNVDDRRAEKPNHAPRLTLKQQINAIPPTDDTPGQLEHLLGIDDVKRDNGSPNPKT